MKRLFTLHIILLATLACMAFMLPSCGGNKSGNMSGKFAGKKVCAVSEEITQEEFEVAVSNKDSYNTYPVRKNLTKESYQNVRQQISMFVDCVQIFGHDFSYDIEEDRLDSVVMYYPDTKDYLVDMEIA